MVADERAALRLRISQLLDELEAEEPLPPGIAPELLGEGNQGNAAAAPDLYTVVEALTALTRETQLQARATSRLNAELTEAMARLLERAQDPEAIARRVLEARREGRWELVSELLDVRDRLERGADEAFERLETLERATDAPSKPPPWNLWRRLRGSRSEPEASGLSHAVLAALLDGNRLSLERLDELLSRLDLREIPAEGLPFDPELMRAVEVDRMSDEQPGAVLEVVRAGYVSQGRVVRYAEVRVAGGTAENEEDGEDENEGQGDRAP